MTIFERVGKYLKRIWGGFWKHNGEALEAWAEQFASDMGNIVLAAAALLLPSLGDVARAQSILRDAETEQFLRDNGVGEYEAIGSSLKFCLLAEGKADVYPRFGRTMEWDTAAADAVLRAAGGQTLCLDNQPLTYGKRQGSTDSDFANPHFVAWGTNPSVPAAGLSTPFEAHRLDSRPLQ